MTSFNRLSRFSLLLTSTLLPVMTVGAREQAAVDVPASASPGPTDAATDAATDVGTVPVQSPSADEPATSSTAPAIRNRAIEEVVVTAQKREEKLQDVPISIQAFSGDAMAARGVENTYQLGQVVPSLQFTDVAGFTLIFMRGIGTDNFIPSADPSIATYIDGIYVPQGHTAAQSLGNVQRVEVLKGPQGTLFGRNATGGAISVITEEPGDVFKASAETEVGSYEDAQVKGSISGPITSWLSASAAGLYKRIDNYYINDNFDLPPTQSQAYRLKVNIHPTEELSLDLTGYRTKQTGFSSTFGNNTSPTLVGRAAGIMPAEDNYHTQSDLDHPKDSATQALYYGVATYKAPWLDIKFLGSHQNIRTAPATIDFDGSAQPLAAFDATNEFSRLQTAELQFLSNDDTPGAEDFKWVAGIYYLHSKAGFDPAHLRAAPGAITALTSVASANGIQLPSVLDQVLAAACTPVTVGTPLCNDGITVQFSGVLGTDSYSGYAQGTYYFNEWVDLTVGGRYQTENRFLTKSETDVRVPGTDYVQPVIPFALPSATAKNFSPKVVLTGHPRENALVYLSYGVGYKSGTYNVVNIYTPPNYIKPERVTTYELGFKVDFFNRLLRVNGAVFDNEIKDLQSGFVSLLSGGAVQFITAGGARTRGVEVDGTLMPLPDIDPGLAITFNAAYVKAEYTDFDPCPGFRPGTGLYAANLDCDGNHIVRSPTLSGGMGLVQAIDVPTGSVELAVDDYYNSGFYYDAENTVKEGKYSVLNARASYLHTPWNTRITAYCKNVLARDYHVQQFQSDFGVTKTLAPPREVGLRFNYDF